MNKTTLKDITIAIEILKVYIMKGWNTDQIENLAIGERLLELSELMANRTKFSGIVLAHVGKSGTVQIDEMDENHLINVLRIALRDEKARDLATQEKFFQIVSFLSDKVIAHQQAMDI